LFSMPTEKNRGKLMTRARRLYAGTGAPKNNIVPFADRGRATLGGLALLVTANYEPLRAGRTKAGALPRDVPGAPLSNSRGCERGF